MSDEQHPRERGRRQLRPDAAAYGFSGRAASKPVKGGDKSPVNREFSAGGVVQRNGKLLLCEVENLKGEIVWTFPKGHLDPGETALQAARREVQEETGWLCRETGKLKDVTYWFTRNGMKVFKKVSWFTMVPLKKMGKPDAVEIRKVRWFPFEKAAQVMKYPSDLALLKELKGRSVT